MTINKRNELKTKNLHEKSSNKHILKTKYKKIKTVY